MVGEYEAIQKKQWHVMGDFITWLTIGFVVDVINHCVICLEAVFFNSLGYPMPYLLLRLSMYGKLSTVFYDLLDQK